MKFNLLSLFFFIFVKLLNAQLIECKGFGNNPGNLKMFYHSDFEQEKLPLVVVLHGCSQNAESIANQSGWNELAQKHKFRVLYPEQKIFNNPSLCFNWFRQNDINRNKGEIHSIAEMIFFMKKKFPTSDVFVYGVSAGAAMTTALLCQYPELFKTGVSLAGGPYIGGLSMFSGLGSMLITNRRTPQEWTVWKDSSVKYPNIIVMHGTKDPVVDFGNSFEIVKQWSSLKNCDTIPEKIEPDFEGLGFIQTKKYADNQGEMAIKWYILEGKGHVLPVNPGTNEKEGGKLGLFAKDFDFFSTWFIANDLGLIK